MAKPLLYETLKVLFREPIVVLMLGDWRMGKTDTSLLCGHLAKKWGLIDKIGSNIWTFNNPEVDYIIKSSRLIKWLHADKLTKLFIFDEALKHAYRRKAMSQKNVEIITEILPELSKGHGRMIFCSQIEKIDTDILHPAFCRAMWRKVNRKTMVCISKHHRPRTFKNLPKSPIRFDPDKTANFVIDMKMSKGLDLRERGKIYEISKLYVDGFSFERISKDRGFHTEEVRRSIKKALKQYLEYEDLYGDAVVNNLLTK